MPPDRGMAIASVPHPTADDMQLISGLGVSRESLARIEAYLVLLFRWQAKTNLVSPATLPEVWRRHVIDSLQLLPHLTGPAGAIADLGSGAGFPGIVLAITSGRQVDLYESNQKKAAFLLEAIRATHTLGRVKIGRLEAVAPPARGEYAFVTARALAPLPELLAYAAPFLASGATGLFLKGRDFDLELTESAKSWRIKADKHTSLTDSEAVLLVVKEASRA
jgi:16S rRNA (guanine527-N7)-methyltransferase